MNPITLSPDEVKLALKGEPFLLIRPVEPQPLAWQEIVRDDEADSGYSFKSEARGRCNFCCEPIKSPFGKPGDELIGEVEHKFGDLTLTEKKIYITHIETTVEKQNDKWVFIGKFEVKG